MAKHDEGFGINFIPPDMSAAKAAIDEFVHVLDEGLKGINVTKYWSQYEEDYINNLKHAVDEFNNSLSQGDSSVIKETAAEVVNCTNALRSFTDTTNLSDLTSKTGIQNLPDIFKDASGRAGELAASMKLVEDSLDVFDILSHSDVSVDKAFNNLSGSKYAEQLQEEINKLKTSLIAEQAEHEKTKTKWKSSEAAAESLRSKIQELKEEIENLRKAGTEEGRGDLLRQLEEAEKKIISLQNKLKNAGNFKAAFQEITTAIDNLSKKIDEIANKLSNGGFAVAEPALQSAIGILNTIAAESTPASEGMTHTAESLTLVIDKLKELASSGNTALGSIRGIFANLPNLDNLTVSKKSIDNIDRFLKLPDAFQNGMPISQLREFSEIDWSKLSTLSSFSIRKDNVEKLERVITAFSKFKRGTEVKTLAESDFSKWGEFKINKSFVDHMTTFIKLINSKTTDIDKFKKFTDLDFSNFNNIKFDKNSLNAMSQLLSSLTVAERLDNLERRLTGGGGGGGGNVPSGSNLVPPDTELDVLGKAMAGVGATDADIERVVGRFTELGLRAQSARAAVAEIGEEGEKLYNIVATTTDEFGNTVSHLIQYSDATNDVSINLGNAANRLKELSEADLSKNLRSVIDLLGSREDLKGTATGQEMSRYADELGKALEAVQTGSMSANDAVNQFVTGGRAGFENLTNVVNQFKLEASQTAKPIEDAAMSEEQRAKAVSQLDAALNTIQANEEKWSAAQNSSKESSRAAYEIYTRQADAIEDLKEKVHTGSISQQEYAESVATIKGEMAECERVIRSNGDAFDKNKNIIENGSAAQEKAVQRVSRAYEEAQENLRKWRSIEKDPVLGTAYKQYEDAANSLAVLDKNLKSGTMTQEEYTREWTRLSGAMASAKKTIDDSGRSFDTVGDKIGKVVSKFSSLFSAVRVFNAVKRVMREMVQNVRDLDSSFAQLRIVTGATDAEMEKFAAVSADLAKNLGQSVTDVTKSIEVFSRLGYNLSDATYLSKFATIMANVGDVTTDAATTGITAIIKGFEMEAADAEHVADVLVNVGQKYAISAEELMTAFEKSGAALHATNTDFEKSVALYAAANASIQNASTVGTALKTLSARIRSSKTDLEELGEDYDDLADGFSKYAEEVKALTGFDIRIEGTTNQYKDLYDIMDGLSKVWDNLSDAAQARTAEILGGTRQLQVIASIISNWGDAAGAYETAMNSMGVATQANEIYMDTLEAKINQFKSTFQEFSYTVLNSDLLKWGVDTGTTILNVLNGLIKGAGNLLPILTAISGLVIIKNFGNIASAGGALVGVLAKLRDNLVNTGKLFDFSWLGAMTGGEMLTAGIGAAIAAYGTAATIYNNARESERAAWEQSVETAKQRSVEAQSVEELEKKYLSAENSYKNGLISKEEYTAATENLAAALGLESNELGNLNQELANYKAESKRLFEDGMSSAKALLDDAANMTFWERIFNPFDAAKYTKNEGRLRYILGMENVDLSTADGILETYDRIIAKMDEMADNAENLDDLSGDKNYQTLKYFANLLGDTAEEYREYYDATHDAAEGTESFADSVLDASIALDDTVDSLDNTAQSVHEATGEWGEYGEALMSATEAQTALDEQLESGDWNDGFEGRIKAFEKFKELLESGMVGSKEFSAYKDYFGLSDMNADAVGQWISNNEKYFQEGVDSVTAFFDTVASKSDELKDIATWDESTGVFWYDSTKLTEFADAMGWTEEQLVDMLGNARMYFEDWETHSPAEAFKEFADAGLFTDFNGHLMTSLEQLRQFTGEDDEAIQSLITSINTLRNNQGLETIKLIDDDQIVITQQTIDNMLAAGETASEITQKIATLSQNSNVEIEPDVHLGPDKLQEVVGRMNSELEAAQNQVTVDVKLNINDEEVTVSLDATKSELESIVGADWQTVLSADNDDVIQKAQYAEDLINGLKQETPIKIDGNNNPAYNAIKTIEDLLNRLNGKTATTYINTVVTTSGHGKVSTNAKGTKNASSGMSLLGDEYSPSGSPKPELVVSDGYAYLAGQHGPEIGYLRSGDVVYNASDTKKILGGAGLNGLIGAFSGGSTFSGGNAPSGYSSSSSNSSSKTKNNNSSSRSSNSSSSSSSSRNSSSKSSSSKEESEFEKLYKAHQHLRAMDQEETEYYLNWLNKAYKEAYKKNEIELEDYYKYEEEVYKGLHDLFEDHISDLQFEIEMRKHYEADARKVYDTYTTIIKDIQKELKKAYAQGLDDNDDYVQGLLRQMWSAKDEQKKMAEEVKKEAKDATEKLVDIRVKMLKQDIKDQKDSLKKQYDDYKDFINKQKELLQEQYDEEDYLEKQKEKRKEVTDLQAQLQMLEVDDSAWAQKRKLEIQQKLTDAQKDLSDFERDYARDQAINELEDLLEVEDEKYNAQILKLEEFENNSYLLRQAALADVKRGNDELYLAMLEWNRIYGDGVDATITEAWTDAYKALQAYQVLYKQVYDNFKLSNATGVKTNTDTWNKVVNPQNGNAKAIKSSSSSSNKSSSSSSSSKSTTSTPRKVTTVTKTTTTYPYTPSKYNKTPGRPMTTAAKATGGTLGSKTGFSLYAGGGWNDYTGWAWMDGTSQKPEAVLNAEQAKNFKDFIDILDDMKASGAMANVYQSSDGARYRILSGGLLGGSLADTATNYGNELLSKIFGSGFNSSKFAGLQNLATSPNITMGDIIVQGSADQKTVSEIRREQRNAVDYMLKELNKLKS